MPQATYAQKYTKGHAVDKKPSPSWISIARKILDDGMTSMISDIFRANNKAVLLGASGQLGQMCRLMWPLEEDLICHSRNVLPGFVSFDQHLVSDTTRETLQNTRAIICLSGVTPKHANQSGDAFSLNTDLALAAVRLAHAAGIGRVFLVSSAAVYGRAQGVLAENSVCEPVSAYGLAKLDMEHAALKLANDLGQPATVLRIGNVAGADAILGGWREGMEIDELPNGHTPRRSYIGPQTLARVLHSLTCAVDLPDVVNVAAPGSVEMGAILDAAGLSWFPRKPSNDVIEKVELSTKCLERYVSFDTQDGTASQLVAEWHRYVQQQ